MGIQGLLPLLKSVTNPTHVKEYQGLRAAVDAYSWLHKAAFCSSKELCNGEVTNRFIDYCMHRVNLLRHHGITPVMVFDGGPLPSKAEQEEKRSRLRSEHLARARQLEVSGNHAAAYEYYQKAVDITPSIALQLIEVLRQENVDFIVSPYEADAQMAFLSLRGHVDVVITEDSDLIAYGCPKILFKMDKNGCGMEFQYADLVKNKDLNFSSFTKRMVLELCVLSGCDYLQSLQGMGVKRAHNLLRRFKNYEKVIRHLRFSGVLVPKAYEDGFEKAIMTFLHHRVYDPAIKQLVHLTELPADVNGDLEFLGPEITPALVVQIAQGLVDPITHISVQLTPLLANTRSSGDCKVTHAKAKDQRDLKLPAQKNVMTNYFKASKRQFKTPRSSGGNERPCSPKKLTETERNRKRLCLDQDDVEGSEQQDVQVQRSQKREKSENQTLPQFSSRLLGDDFGRCVPLCSKVDHTETYACIAQESIDKFTATVSSFKYQAQGARVSGLRPPLKSSNLFNQFALTSSQSSTWRRS